MKTILMTMTVLSVTSTLAFAQQTAPVPPTQNDAPAVNAPASPAPAPGAPVTTPEAPPAGAPVPGENSFTEAQAKDRIAEAGYSQVGTLMLDSNGVWRGTAMKDGRSVNVGLDYQGNIVEQ